MAAKIVHPAQNFPPMTATELSDFLAERGAIRKCTCGGDEWDVVVIDGKDGNEILFEATMPDPERKRYLSYFPRHCTRCGETQMISAAVALAWRADRV